MAPKKKADETPAPAAAAAPTDAKAAGAAAAAPAAAADGAAAGGAEGGKEDGTGAGAGAGGDADAPLDNATKSAVQKIPLLTVKAGPRDKAEWVARLKEELQALIAYVKLNKQNDNDWFFIESNATGTRWTGKCWHIYKMVKYEFDVEFEIPVAYPASPFEIVIAELDGKTAKMYRGGKICLSAHFKPLWARNVPAFGIPHALALGLGPWLAAEVPHLVDAGLITKK